MKQLFAPLLLAVTILAGPACAERVINIPIAASDASEPGNQAIAVLAGGCFWGMEAVFEHVRGVKSVVSGYAGGTASTANYSDVSNETTRHAEAVRITYDPTKVSYATLLRIYFAAAHDPTQLNRQGPDTGTSYRSAIFPQSAEQRRVAAAYIAQLTVAKAWPRPISTRIEQGQFFQAEGYHQDFMARNPTHPYIMRFDVPKLAGFRAAFPALAR